MPYKRYPKGLKINKENEHLVLENINVANKLAHKWHNGVCDFEDIKQQAYLTLVDCATKYDINADNKFSTYAYACINFALNNYVQRYNKLVNIPLNKLYSLYRYTKLLKTDEEKETFKKSKKLTDDEIHFYSTYEMLSMNQQIVDDYDDAESFYFVSEPGYNVVENNLLLQKVLGLAKHVITNKLHLFVFLAVIKNDFDESRYNSIANEFNITIKNVHEIILSCQKIMRKHKNLIE